MSVLERGRGGLKEYDEKQDFRDCALDHNKLLKWKSKYIKTKNLLTPRLVHQKVLR
jgi:hypothetical protein